jgi:RHS repeat-associated protein
VIEERQNGTGTSNVSYQYVWGAGYIDELVLRDSYSGGSRTLRLYVQQDANLNVTAVISTSGAVQERYLYDPYGSVTITDASYNPRSGNTSNYGWIYLHQGGRLDGVTGWYIFRFRDYIPSEGRWAERDPIGYESADLNLYCLEASSPIDRIDAYGTKPDDEAPAMSAAETLRNRQRRIERELSEPVRPAPRSPFDVTLLDPGTSKNRPDKQRDNGDGKRKNPTITGQLATGCYYIGARFDFHPVFEANDLESAVEQIEDLARAEKLRIRHIYIKGHGARGMMLLGGSTITIDSFDPSHLHYPYLVRLRKLLDTHHGMIIIEECSVLGGPEGQAFGKKGSSD